METNVKRTKEVSEEIEEQDSELHHQFNSWVFEDYKEHFL